MMALPGIIVTVKNKGEIKLAIANFCAVTNKKSELVTFLNLHDIDILCGTESHFYFKFSQNFNTFRNDNL